MMRKRLQICLTDDAWTAVESLVSEANQNFDVGSINYSDAINEMILTAKIDLKTLQLKHTDLRRSLKAMAAKEEIDIDSAIKILTEMKSKAQKRQPKATAPEEAS